MKNFIFISLITFLTSAFCLGQATGTPYIIATSTKVPTVTGLICGTATIIGGLIPGVAASGVSASVPYTGGDGGSYSSQTVSSTGITGLTATLAAGTLAIGSGSVVYTITGIPSAPGPASFAISLGGQTCTLSVSTCGAFVAPGVWKSFMCQNLGADMTADAFTPSAAIHGAKYQWGYKPSNPLVSDNRYYTQNDDQANTGSIAGWNTTVLPDGSWLDASKTANDPCPTGYRVPTQAQWNGVTNNNTVTRTGSWANSFTNYTTALSFGSALLLPATGGRYTPPSTLNNRGISGMYWSSTRDTNSAPNAYAVQVNRTSVNWGGFNRTNGFSVRCISE